MVKQLLDKGANVNARNRRGQSPVFSLLGSLRSAIASPNFESLPVVLEGLAILRQDSANLDPQDLQGRTIFHETQFIGSPGFSLALIKAGANRNIKDQSGKTPIKYSKRASPASVNLRIGKSESCARQSYSDTNTRSYRCICSLEENEHEKPTSKNQHPHSLALYE